MYLFYYTKLLFNCEYLFLGFWILREAETCARESFPSEAISSST